MARQTLTVGLLALLVVATVPSPAIASSDGGLGVFDAPDTPGEWLDTSSEAWQGVLDRVAWEAKHKVASLTGDTSNDAVVKHADNLQTSINTNNQSIQSYVNERFGGTHSEWDVVAVEMTLNGNTETRYIVSDVNNSSFQNGQMVNSTNRTVDKTVQLEGYAVVQADDEVERFVAEKVEPNEDLDQDYLTRMAEKFGGDVTLPAGVM